MNADKVKGAAQSANEAGASTARELGESATSAASDAINAGQGYGDQSSAKAADLYGRAKGHVQGLSDRLPNATDAYQAGQRAYAQGSEHVGRHVSKQPIEALLLAGAIGYLVGWATSRS